MGQVEKLPALTGLRFLAAALILLHHAKGFKVPIPDAAFGQAVSIFFVLSGFILAHVYPRLETWDATKRFLILRVARIWPAHVAALFLAVAAYGIAINRTFPANALLVHSWVPSSPWYFGYNAVSWTISTEFFFYLMFPLLIWNWRKTLWWKLLAAIGLLVSLCMFASAVGLHVGYSSDNTPTTHGLLYINPLARLLEFIVGMAAYSAFAWLKPYGAALKARWPTTLTTSATLAEAGLLLLVWYALTSHPFLALLHYVFGSGIWTEWAIHAANFPIFALLLIVFGLGYGFASTVFSTKLAIVLGEISYSVYLLHQIVYSYYLSRWAPDASGLAICIAVVIMVSYAFWRAVEVPCRAAVKERYDQQLISRACR